MMEWEAFGFTDDPLSTDPIKQKTLSLFVGRDQQVRICEKVLAGKNVNLLIEGAKGVGTTSFANLLRFHAQEKKLYFTPAKEIPVAAGWTLETLFAVIIANIVRNLELNFAREIKNNQHFKDAKAISNRIAEIYRSFGGQMETYELPVRGDYNKSAGIISQPTIIPANALADHIKDLASIAKKLGFKNGILLQLNNLDLGVIHEEAHLKYLLNSLRDYLQTDGLSWILVGDHGLRSLFAQKVDRLDDIISHEVSIQPLSEKEFAALIDKRIEFFRMNRHVELPIDWDVMIYLYRLTKGRLRTVFGLIERMLRILHVGDLADKISLKMAKPLVNQLIKERLRQKDISKAQEEMLTVLAKKESCSVVELAKAIGKSPSNISHLLKPLEAGRLLKRIKKGKHVFVYPVFDVIIAYAS